MYNLSTALVTLEVRGYVNEHQSVNRSSEFLPK